MDERFFYKMQGDWESIKPLQVGDSFFFEILKDGSPVPESCSIDLFKIKIQKSKVRNQNLTFLVGFRKNNCMTSGKKSRFAEVLAQVAMIFLSLGVRKGFCEKETGCKKFNIHWIDASDELN